MVVTGRKHVPGQRGTDYTWYQCEMCAAKGTAVVTNGGGERRDHWELGYYDAHARVAPTFPAD